MDFQDRKMYLQLFAVVLHDVSGCVNLAFRMTKSALAEVFINFILVPFIYVITSI